MASAPLGVSPVAEQVRFCAELATMFVAAAGLVHVLASPAAVRLRGWRRVVAAAGSAVALAAALTHGAALVHGDPHGSLGLARLASGCAVAVSVWPARAGRRRVSLVGGLLWALAGGATLTAAPEELAEALLAAGTVALGAALVLASRQSVAARVTANGATTLLLVVLVVSVALSAVISSTVQREELDHLRVRARAEAADLGEVTASVARDARFAAGDLAGYFHQSDPDPLVTLGGPPGVATGAAAAAVTGRLRQLAALYPLDALVYARPGTGQVAARAGVGGAAAAALAGAPQLGRLGCAGGGQGMVLGTSGGVWAVGALPECASGSRRPLGVVVAAEPLGAAYLRDLRARDPAVSLALAGPRTVWASAGPQPPAPALLGVAAGAAPTIRGARALGAVAVPVGPGGPPLRLVVSTSTSPIAASRDRLTRDLFLIALGGAVLAFGLAALTAERIAAGLRRLTHVSGRIQRGETAERAGIATGDEIGQLAGAFDAMLDSVEAQTAALQAAAEDEARLRDRLQAVVAGMGDGLVALDASGRVTEYNRAAAELAGTPPDAALGRPAPDVLQLLGEDGRPLQVAGHDPAPGRWARVADLRRPDGTTVPVGVSAGALRGPAGEVAGSVLVLRDLRREREIEAMKSEFLSRAGHELRTPLTGILGYAEMLLRREVPAGQARSWTEEILAGAKRLQRIVEMLEFFASSGAGRSALQPRAIDARALLDPVVRSWADRLPGGHTLTHRIAEATPPLLADRRWLALAVDELLDNAVKFSPAGGRIHLSAGPSASVAGGPEDVVLIAVSDEGRGMSPEEQAGIFGEFAQGDASDTRPFGGLGLGLALVHRVAEGHGGRVTLRSTPGGGSTFTINLPVG